MNDLTTTDKNYSSVMKQLTEKQRAFVIARVWKGFNQTESARDAGYSATSNNTLAVIGHDLAHDPRIIAAIREETMKLKDSEGANCLRTLIAIRDDPTAEKSVRRKCATDILDRSGYPTQTEHTVHVNHREETSEEKIRQIVAMAKQFDIDPRKFLGDSYIEGKYEVVPPVVPEAEISPARDRENELRRLKRSMTPAEWDTHKANTRAEKSERGKETYKQHQQQLNGETVADVTPLAELPDDLSDILGE